jgi:hypothetical protein
MLPSKNPLEPNPFLGTQPVPSVLDFFSISIGCPSVVENSRSSVTLIKPEIKGFKLI